ncbi:DUF4232 domain-containing protein [Streptomyces dysideae]|uniref:DUF4232 domain-containing protein n=1 Tax=Streptomyces dysideae TaxID=909626 RepID=A0A101UUT7_9ACTN|nr:DUF4232 domain-containing protein [Streptomyces dysideae]KUO17293.1 hypothetical protein AQJ91_30990 [Streptomyces dysideae]
MRATPLPLAVLAAALLLTACSDEGDKGTDTSQDSTACKIDEVAVEVGPANAAPAVGDTGNVPITITNRAEECTLDGLPAVEFDAGDIVTNAVPDPAAEPQKLTLAKDQAVSFTITYVRGEADPAKSLAVKKGKFMLPGSTATHSFPWSYGDVAIKGAGPEADATTSGFTQVGD